MHKAKRNGGKAVVKNRRSVKTDEFYLGRMREILAVNCNARPPCEPVEMLENVFMGSQKHAEDFDILRKYGITHVVNCAGSKLVNCNADQNKSPSSRYPEGSGITDCLVIGAVDHEDYEISVHFERAIDFLNSAEKEGGRTLVHCNLGVNRSGAIMAAYLMVHQKRSLLSVIDYIKQKRSVVLSNKGFRKQLIFFAKKKGLLEDSEPKISGADICLDGYASHHIPVKLQSFDYWIAKIINCKVPASKFIQPKCDSKNSPKNKLQTGTIPKISDRSLAFSRSFTRWRSKYGENNMAFPDTKSPDLYRQLDPVHENCTTDFVVLSNAPSDKTKQKLFKPLLKVPGDCVKSSLSDFHLYHSSSSAIVIEDFNRVFFSSTMRPLKIFHNG